MRMRLLAASLLLVACAQTGAGRQGLDVDRLPAQVRPDYQLFSQRCSKCHPLARALQSGIDRDAAWVDYVARMRRQPGSGISADDATRILRFLHYYALEQRRLKGEREPPPSPPPVSLR